MSACVRDYTEVLSEDYRHVLVLHDEQNLTSAEIAAMLGVSVDAAKIRLHRARRKLQAILNEGCDFSHDEDNVFVCDPSDGHEAHALRPAKSTQADTGPGAA